MGTFLRGRYVCLNNWNHHKSWLEISDNNRKSFELICSQLTKFPNCCYQYENRHYCTPSIRWLFHFQHSTNRTVNIRPSVGFNVGWRNPVSCSRSLSWAYVYGNTWGIVGRCSTGAVLRQFHSDLDETVIFHEYSIHLGTARQTNASRSICSMPGMRYPSKPYPHYVLVTTAEQFSGWWNWPSNSN